MTRSVNGRKESYCFSPSIRREAVIGSDFIEDLEASPNYWQEICVGNGVSERPRNHGASPRVPMDHKSIDDFSRVFFRDEHVGPFEGTVPLLVSCRRLSLVIVRRRTGSDSGTATVSGVSLGH